MNVRKKYTEKGSLPFIYYLKNYSFDFHTIQSVGRTLIVLDLQIFAAQNTTVYGHESIRAGDESLALKHLQERHLSSE